MQLSLPLWPKLEVRNRKLEAHASELKSSGLKMCVQAIFTRPAGPPGILNVSDLMFPGVTPPKKLPFTHIPLLPWIGSSLQPVNTQPWHFSSLPRWGHLTSISALPPVYIDFNLQQGHCACPWFIVQAQCHLAVSSRMGLKL